ncbi:MAG: ornithine cyclodeaminase family protein [Anaerolineae bacterium]
MSARILVVKREDVDGRIQIKDCISLVAKAFGAWAEGKVEMPTKYHYAGQFGLWFFMGGNVEPLGAMAVKLGCAPPGRASCQVIYYDHVTAQPLALMEGMWVTALRTGAAAAVGAKHLARPGSRVVSIVGSGTVGWNSLVALRECFSIEKAYAADASADARRAFAERARARYDFPVVEASVEEAARAADILVTATPSREPIVKAEWIRAGTHISAMGADSQGKQELDSRLHQKARIVCDSVEQCLQWGDINNSVRAGLLNEERIVGNIGEVILGRKKGRTSEEDITLFDATGMGIQDAAVAKLIYETALREGLGMWAEL